MVAPTASEIRGSWKPPSTGARLTADAEETYAFVAALYEAMSMAAKNWAILAGETGPEWGLRSGQRQGWKICQDGR